MIFIDTGPLFSLMVPNDHQYQQARMWFSKNKAPLIITDYIADEVLTLLKARGFSERAFDLGVAIFSGALARIHYLTEEDIFATWQTFRTYSDKEWSFTDCSSKVVIEKPQISQSFSFDHHFL